MKCDVPRASNHSPLDARSIPLMAMCKNSQLNCHSEPVISYAVDSVYTTEKLNCVC